MKVHGARGRDAPVCGCPGAREGDGIAAARHDSINLGGHGRFAARVRGRCRASGFRRGVRGLAAFEGHVGGARNDKCRDVLDGDVLNANVLIAAPAHEAGMEMGGTARFKDRWRQSQTGRGGDGDADADDKSVSQANTMILHRSVACIWVYTMIAAILAAPIFCFFRVTTCEHVTLQ